MEIGNQQLVVGEQGQRVCVVETIVTDRNQGPRSRIVKTAGRGIAHQQYHARRRFVIWIVRIRFVEVTAGGDDYKLAAGGGRSAYHGRRRPQGEIGAQVVRRRTINVIVAVGIARYHQYADQRIVQRC